MLHRPEDDSAATDVDSSILDTTDDSPEAFASSAVPNQAVSVSDGENVSEVTPSLPTTLHYL